MTTRHVDDSTTNHPEVRVMGLPEEEAGRWMDGETTALIRALLEKLGGVEGVLTQFRTQGLGEIARSWVGTGERRPVTAQQLQRALGTGTIQELADRFGMSPPHLAHKLSHLLPQSLARLAQ